VVRTVTNRPDRQPTNRGTGRWGLPLLLACVVGPAWAGPPPADAGPPPAGDSAPEPTAPPSAGAPTAEPPPADATEPASPPPAADAAEPEGAVGPRMPAPLDIAAAPYPPGALAAGRGAEVLLELSITPEGEVAEVRVVEPAGHGFDESAAQAAADWRFSPALDADGAAVPAVIQYRYRFSVESAPVVSLEGLLKATGTREPMADADLVLVGPDGTQRTTRSDEDGRFQAVDLAPGTWTLLAAAPGHTQEQVEVSIAAGKVAELTLYLELSRPWEAARADAEIVVEGERIAPELTERRVSADDIRYLPGSGGDIVRAVQNMPGVARSSFNAGQVQVRGTTSENTGFFLGGAPLPIVFHFGGLSTVVNSDSLDEVAFMPGGYGVRYGRKLAGVVDLRTDKDLPERSHGYASVDLFQATAFVEQRIGDDWAVTVSGRRSYIDRILQPILNGQTTSEIRLPRYWDIQARALMRQDNGSSLDMMVLASDDRFTLREPDSDGEDGYRESLLISKFSRLWLQYRWEMGGGWLSEHTLAGGPETLEVEFRDDEEAWQKPVRFSWRSELYRGVPEDGHIGWRMGVDMQAVQEHFKYELAGFGDMLSFQGNESGEAWSLMPAVYLEQTQEAGPLQGIPGIRIDWIQTTSGYQATAIDPRFRSKLDLGDTTQLLLATGRYSQFPQAREYMADLPEDTLLLPQWSAQVDLGAKQEVGGDVNIEAHAYHWWLYDLVSGREDRFEFELGPPPVPPLDTDNYASEGTGRVIGGELLARYETDRTLAWLSVTLSRSMRTDRPDEPELVFDQDQPVVINALASHQLPRRWRVGARWRFASGKPYVPVANRVLDLSTHTFLPVWDESARSRLANYHALDVRVDKDWVYDKWTLTAYLDLMNATNRRNLEMVTPSADYTQEIPVYGLPIIPAFGVRGAW
jgi:TonB family protein